MGPMKDILLAVLVFSVALVLSIGAASARGPDKARGIPSTLQSIDERHGRAMERSAAGLETLWIFDADFSTMTGDNAGWTSYDRSGVVAQTNYWHHDTIRIDGFGHLGDTTWWCGTYDEHGCWAQPRGYCNNWVQVLERHFDEHVEISGASLTLEYDQRYAMEGNYDFGYVDLRSVSTGDTWRSLVALCNPGGWPGASQDWDSTDPNGPGHMAVDITDYVADEFDLRFRFVSDWGTCSQTDYDNPPQCSYKDGAWQLDNITLYVDTTVVFFDDAESGDPWSHDDVGAAGQTGVTFWRGQYGIDFITGRGFMCGDRPVGSWMYAAVDPGTSTLVDDQNCWLISPPIDISGAERVLGQSDYWLDFTWNSCDYFNVSLASNDLYDCVADPEEGGFLDTGDGGIHYGGPTWSVRNDDWDAFAGRDWLAIRWEVFDWDWFEPTEPHMGGVFLNRQRVGIPSGDPGTVFEVVWTEWFNDWYIEQLAEALVDSAHIAVTDRDTVVSVRLMASNDAGQSWESYTCQKEGEGSPVWCAPPPATQMTQGSEIWYYFEATDGWGTVSLHPEDAPDRYFEMSILPMSASVSDPGLLLVDKIGHGGYTKPPSYWYTEYSFIEVLEILGYEWDVYDVEASSGMDFWWGPDTMAYKYYDTQIWAFASKRNCTLSHTDQENLIAWLNQAGEGKERNLLLTGDGLGFDLVESGNETLGFYATWLASDYLGDAVGVVTVDSLPGLRECGGGWTFMDHDDSECVLRGGCPGLRYFDRLQPAPGLSGTEVVLDYVKLDSSTEPAGVAYIHPSLGYQTVNLGFSMSSMRDAGAPNGYYETGIEDRVNLMSNIMDYFGRPPDGSGTGIGDAVVRDELSAAHPNPFNPLTKISYGVKEAGRVTVAVYNVAGRVVRTLLDVEVAAGTAGFVVWDGTDDAGQRCGSGVYFYRIAAPGFAESRKMVLLK